MITLKDDFFKLLREYIDDDGSTIPEEVFDLLSKVQIMPNDLGLSICLLTENFECGFTIRADGKPGFVIGGPGCPK